MFDFFSRLMARDFMPHGTCYLWRPEVVWLHAVSDALIALAYFSIPLAIWQFVRRRQDLAFHWLFLLFAGFILFCGTTHVLAIWTLWSPVYRLEGLVKALTAVISMGTAVAMIPVIPRALALPRPSDLAAANRALAAEISERKQVEAEVRRLNAELERRVEERTAELARSNHDLARSNQDLERFAYIASHDLQEPLRMVASYTQLLARRYRGQLDEEADTYIGFAVEGSKRMHSLINDLLSYARINAAQDVHVAVDMNEAARQALTNLELVIAEAGAEVTVDPLPTVMGNRAQLVSVLQNLVGNGIKYRRAEPPRIRVSAIVRGRDHEFCVEDNGMGIADQYREEIFVPFKRLQRDTSGGNGIGLAICQRAILRHGGKIWVVSQPGLGSAFHFTIPVREEE